MFKKLKEKITENSPQRLQQFTQSVSDKFQNNTAPDENFFSLTEEDAASPSKSESGFSSVSLVSPSENRARKMSNSSIASDISFLPRYDSSFNSYQLQSDFEASASELEDNTSSSSQLGHLGKEQIYSAFQKAQMRYHKYRGRYTDLAKHYKELERENSKMKSVLVETQDKAIRRVNELKEQCSLEQKAKAHLESALRDEIDEKNLKIEALKTKNDLLQKNGNDNFLNHDSSKENSTESLEKLTKYLNEAREEIIQLNSKTQELKAKNIIFDAKEAEYKNKIQSLGKEITVFEEREKENNLKLAQNKMELHNELISKEAEINSLKKDNEVLKESLEQFETSNKTTNTSKLENLQSQNKKLIEKIEDLKKKQTNFETELLKLEQYKLEIKNLKSLKNDPQIIENLKTENSDLKNENNDLKTQNSDLKTQNSDLKNQIIKIRDETKTALLSLESKITQKLSAEFLLKETTLKNDFSAKLEEVSSDHSSLKDLQIKNISLQEEIKTLQNKNATLSSNLLSATSKYAELEENHLGLINDAQSLRSKLSSNEKDLLNVENLHDTISRLQATVNTSLEEISALKSELSAKNQHLEEKTLECAKLLEEKRLVEEKLVKLSLDATDSRINVQKSQKLEETNQNMEATLKNLEKDFGQLEIRRNLLETELDSKNNDITTLKATFAEISAKLLEETTKNQKLEETTKILPELNKKIRLLEEELQSKELDTNEHKLLQLKLAEYEKKHQILLETCENLKITNSALNKDKNDLNSEFNKLKESSATSVQKLVNELEETFRKLAEKEQTLIETQNKLEALIKEKIDLNSELNNFKDISAKNIKMHIDNLEETTRKLAEKEQTLAETKIKLADCLQEIKNREREANQLMQKLEEKLKELEETKRKLEETTQKLEETSQKLKEINQKLEETNKKQVEEPGLKIAEITRALDETNAKLEETTHELEENKTQLAEKVLQLENANKILEKSKEIIQKLNESRVTLEETESKLEENEQKMEELQNKCSTLENINVKLQESINQLEETIIAYKNSLEESKQKEEENKTKLEEAYQNLTKSSQELEKTETVLENKEADLEESVKQLEESNLKLEESNTKLEEITAEHLATLKVKNELEENFRTLEENSRTLEEKFKKISSDKTEIGVQLEEMRIQNEELVLRLEEISRKQAETKADDFLSLQQDFYETKAKYDSVIIENKNASARIVKLEENLAEMTKNEKNVENQVKDLEKQITELLNEKQLLLEEIDELKLTPIQKNSDNNQNMSELNQEIEILQDKLTKYKSLDITNKSSIEFYENELQKFKNKNEKLNTKLDETLVTLNHFSQLSSSTEIEYLRNVLYNYMLGKESIVLARVIAAVCKFDPEQTEIVIQKEMQKQTLLGQLGIL